MTRHTLYQVDAFADRLFTGNPAAVMILDAFLPDATAYLVPRGPGAYDLRWFTPGAEVPLCGHATLAAAHVLWTEEGVRDDALAFETLSGALTVTRGEGAYHMDFPADPPSPIAPPEGLAEALGTEPAEVLAGQYLLAVLEDEGALRDLSPDLLALARLRAPRGRGTAEDCVCVTAPGSGGYDFVSRFFGPTVGITEDPVTGSAHCMLTPYWAGRTGRTALRAYQASARGGEVACRLGGDRVRLGGRAVTYMKGEMRLP